MTGRPPRQRTPRSLVKLCLRAMRADLLTALDRWNVGTLVAAIDPRVPEQTTEIMRPRRPWEYPEWRVADWQVLDRELSHVAEQVDELRAFAAQQLARLHCAGCGDPLNVHHARANMTRCERCLDPNDTAADQAERHPERTQP